MNEMMKKEKDMDRILDRVWNGYRLLVLGELANLLLLELEERMKMAEEWWSSVLKGTVYR